MSPRRYLNNTCAGRRLIKRLDRACVRKGDDDTAMWHDKSGQLIATMAYGLIVMINKMPRKEGSDAADAP